MTDLQAPPLPSQSSAAALVSGDMSALLTVLLHLTGRAALIAIGMALVGERDPGRVAKNALAGAALIEVFVLIHELAYRINQQQQAQRQQLAQQQQAPRVSP